MVCGSKLKMYEILETLAERHVTPTRVMIRVLARCCNCGATRVHLKPNVDKSNNEKRPHCAACRKTIQHRMTGTRPYRIWRGLVARIEKPETKGFQHYGGRGIELDPTWLDFKNFWRDMQPGYSDELTIERKNVNGPYSKANCRWATNAEQQANKRNNTLVLYQGRSLHLAEFCRLTGVTRGAIRPYLTRHSSGDAAIAAYRKSTYPRYRKSRKLSSI